MKSDNRLWRVLHVLIHMNHSKNPMTSEALAAMLQTNPAVVRRTMAGLREKGYVQSAKGHGGGWRLTRLLDDITLLDVYEALGAPAIFSIAAADDDLNCLVEQAVNEAVREALEKAKQALLERFGQIKLSQIEDNVDVLRKAMGQFHHQAG